MSNQNVQPNQRLIDKIKKLQKLIKVPAQKNNQQFSQQDILLLGYLCGGDGDFSNIEEYFQAIESLILPNNNNNQIGADLIQNGSQNKNINSNGNNSQNKNQLNQRISGGKINIIQQQQDNNNNELQQQQMMIQDDNSDISFDSHIKQQPIKNNQLSQNGFDLAGFRMDIEQNKLKKNSQQQQKKQKNSIKDLYGDFNEVLFDKDDEEDEEDLQPIKNAQQLQQQQNNQIQAQQSHQNTELLDDADETNNNNINANQNQNLNKPDKMKEEWEDFEEQKVDNQDQQQEYNKNQKSNQSILNAIKKQEEEEKANLELIKLLQEEDDKQLEQLRNERKKQEEEDVTCAICFDDLWNGDEVVALNNCDHIYHSDCFKGHIVHTITLRDNSKFKCPEEDCQKSIEVDHYKYLLTSKEYIDYQTYSLQNFVDTHGDEMTWCPTADCDYVFVLEDDASQNNFVCPKCSKHYCLSCRVVYHQNQTCKEYEITNKRDENDDKFDKYVNKQKMKQCNKCKAIVSKNQGCDHMTCRCGYQFCYKCGGKYMACECNRKQREQMEENRRRQAEIRANKKSARGRKRR